MPTLMKGKCKFDEISSEEDLKDIAEAKKDIQAGRV